MSSNKECNEAELCDLLDSTLDDFCRKEESLNTNNNESQSSASSIGNKTPLKSFLPKTQTPSNTPNVSSPSGGTSSPADPFEIFESDPQLRENWSKIIKSCNDDNTNFDDLDFQESLQQTLKLISEKAKEISQNENTTNDQFLNTLKNLDELKNFDEQFAQDGSNAQNAGSLNNIMPLMSDIMENLLSKEFLFPTLSDLQRKYPDYLKQNKDKLPSAEFERYKAQYEIVEKICEEFELEDEQDSAEVKQARFQQILAHMQAMQGYGSPPSDLVSPNDPSSSNGSNGLPDLSALEQGGCCVM